MSFNEEPKASISERAIINDFKGEFVSYSTPLRRITERMQKWSTEKTLWWSLKNKEALENLSIPVSASKDEWAKEFKNLTKLVHEGFEVKYIRDILNSRNIIFDKNEGSISLLEKLINQAETPHPQLKLDGLRTAQLIRSKVDSHSTGTEANQLALMALKQHDTYPAHFKYICELIDIELEKICKIFSKEELTEIHYEQKIQK